VWWWTTPKTPGRRSTLRALNKRWKLAKSSCSNKKDVLSLTSWNALTHLLHGKVDDSFGRWILRRRDPFLHVMRRRTRETFGLFTNKGHPRIRKHCGCEREEDFLSMMVHGEHTAVLFSLHLRALVHAPWIVVVAGQIESKRRLLLLLLLLLLKV
jgi:hypothetical protein